MAGVSLLGAPGLLGAASPAGASSAGAAVVRTGWNVYDGEINDEAHRAAVIELKPTMIRWFVAWDRWHLITGSGGFPPPAPSNLWRAGDFAETFELLKPSAANPAGTKLIVQIEAKHNNWMGDLRPWPTPGTMWAKPAKWFGPLYPHDPDASYGEFVRDLKEALNDAGVESSFGAWNEPDLRRSPFLALTSNVQNFTYPWAVKPFDFYRGWPLHAWTGGAQEKWQELHDQLPDEMWTTSGITHDAWIQHTAQVSGIGVLDIHAYFSESSSAASVAKVRGEVAKWDAALGGTGLPFFVGETADRSVRANTDVRQAARVFQRHSLLLQESNDPSSPLFGRYLGTTIHALDHAAWEIDLDDPAAAWWDYDPAYDEHYD